MPDEFAVTLAEVDPLRFTVAPLPTAPSEPEISKATAKLIALGLAPLTVTVCEAGLNVRFPPDGVTV